MSKETVVKEYRAVSPDSLRELAEGMRNLARTVTFDVEAAANKASKMPNSEKCSGMVRVRGPKQIAEIQKYMKFITLDGRTPLQLTYVEMNIENKRVGQLTIVDNNGNELDEDQVEIVASAIFGSGRVREIGNTPQHVVVIVKEV